MYNIALLSASVRTGRASHRVALYLTNYIQENKLGTVDLTDLAAYQFPVFEERLSHLQNPPAGAFQFAERITKSEGVIIVTPEYNGGYPASLKNAVDLLYPEWKRKPIGLATVSSGAFGGSQVGTSLSFSFLKIGALVTPAVFRVPNVQSAYNEEGQPTDKEKSDKRAKSFLDEFFWIVEAKKRMAEAP
ncbi:MAG: NAD(P)H-dependent oxidoreductase [Chitinophagaceae bacterium]|nr:MAG: NAD(P)H-dependent oxidoreductase [Chitinophagaceae bacterium]